jgi:TonB-dependent starch-binding outer membrane protein SusC
LITGKTKTIILKSKPSIMNLKRLFMAFVLPLVCFAFANAQDKVVTGRVTDSKDGTPLQSVTVMVKGNTKIGTQTAADGSFRLSVPANATTLVFSSVGFASQEVAIGNGNLNVALVAGAGTNLNEVVVVGYGTTRKRDLTGAVATVNARDFQKGNIATPEQLIAGKVAGVSIISNGGQPGSGSTIRIRGGSSLSASNDPLIVIDGVPLSNGGIAGGNNPLSFINANDIESFTVLKDASAAAIYGTRAANGVILITTKRGAGGKLRMNFSTVNSVSSVRKHVEVLSADQVRQIVNTLGTANQKAQLGTANTDWQDEIYQTALATDNNLSFSGGIKSLPYRVSLGYLNQEGVLKTDHQEKYSAALVLTPTLLNNHLKVNLNLKGAMQKYRFANQGAIGAAIYFDPTKPVYSNSKRFGGYWEWLNPEAGASYGLPWNRAGRNPLAMLYDREDRSNAKRSIGNLQLDYSLHFLPELHANLNLGYDVSKGTGTIYVSDSSSLEYTTGGENNHYKQTKQNTLLEFYLNYTKDLASIRSRIDATAGYSFNNYQTTNYSFASYRANGTKVPQSDPKYPFDKPENTLISFFGRVNYTLHDKYLLTATIRRDGSSRFAPSNRWGTFPSLALAWKIKDESFMKANTRITDLKLRLGYGITGQQEGIGNYDYLSYYQLSDSGASYSFGNTYYQMFRPGGFYANRKWEQTTTYNIGLDYGFLDNRISGSVDVYLKKTKDLLNSIPQPAGTNFAAYILANVGSMENKGVEFSVTVQPVRNKNVTWDVSFNATYNKNTITQLTVIPDDPYYPGFPSTGISGSQGFAFLNAVGGSKNTFYLYHQIYDQSGKPIENLFEDLNRDGIINEKDKYKGKRADPNMFFGLSTNLNYKKWNAGFVMRASVNNYLYNNVYSNNGRLNQVLNAYVLGNASVNYLESGFTGAAEQQPLSDYYIQNASFVKMDNLFVGYNVGKILKNKASLRTNLSIQNVFTITKYKGLDPEVSWGVDNNFYPRPRIIALGLNLDF